MITNTPTPEQIESVLRWWRVWLCDLPEMILYTDQQTIADMQADMPDLMTASPIYEHALPVAAYGLSAPIHGGKF